MVTELVLAVNSTCVPLSTHVRFVRLVVMATSGWGETVRVLVLETVQPSLSVTVTLYVILVDVVFVFVGVTVTVEELDEVSPDVVPLGELVVDQLYEE